MQQRGMLVILLATCERALEAFHAADNAVDSGLVADLERVAERTRSEIAALAASSSGPGGEPKA